SQSDVSNAAQPRSGILMFEAKRDRQLNLIPDSETPLVDDFVGHRGGALGVDRRGDNGFVLWKSLVGDHGTWQIELAARPAVAAETAHVLNHFLNLVGLQRLGEGRHDLREPSGGSSIVDVRLPVR